MIQPPLRAWRAWQHYRTRLEYWQSVCFLLQTARDNFVGLTRNRDTSEMEEVYSMKGKVNWLAFSQTGGLLAIGCQ